MWGDPQMLIGAIILWAVTPLQTPPPPPPQKKPIGAIILWADPPKCS